MDSQFEANLPALNHCSQLSSFSLCGNLLSMAVMEKMLRHTAGLPCLSQEWYPAPQESYSPQGVPLEGRLAHLRTQLLEILRDLGQPRIIRIFLSPCPHNGEDLCCHVEPIIYSYSTPALMVVSMKSFLLGTWKQKSRTCVLHNMKIYGFRHQLNLNGQRKDDPVEVQDCKGKCRLWKMMALSMTWVK